MPADPSTARLTTDAGVDVAGFVARENRFVCRVRRADGEIVRAHLANTARLEDLLVVGAAVVLHPARDPRRRTRWSLTRVLHGDTWVALEAARAADLVSEALRAGRALPGWPPAVAVRREVVDGPHRLDLALELADGSHALVEVKSLSRVVDGHAPLSATPSSRGVRQLAHLGEVARSGRRAAVVFVVQRGDVAALDLGQPAEPTWVAAVRHARHTGVAVMAFRCEVTATALRLGTAIPVLDGPDPSELVEPYASTWVELEAPGHPPLTIVPDPGGQTPGSLPALVPAGTRRLHVLTAWNPRSHRLDDDANAHRNRALLAAIHAAGLPVLRADGRAPDGSWHEPGFALLDTEVERALDLARRYGQHAIFELTGDHLRVLWTDPVHPPLTQGWRVAPVPLDRDRRNLAL